MVTFISKESRIDVRCSPLVTCDMFSETHIHTQYDAEGIQDRERKEEEKAIE